MAFNVNDIYNRLNILTAFMNNVSTLSKKIIELPASTAGTKLIATWNTTSNATEQFNLTAALADVFSVTNRVLTRGDRTRVSDTFTYEITPQPFTWRYDGVNYTGIETDIEILAASTGNRRIDIVVVDNMGLIRKIEGFEVASPGVVTPPDVEPGSLLLDTYYIDETTISDGIDSGTPVYLIYEALLTQVGTGAPTADLLNDLSLDYLGDIVWAYMSPGNYEGTLAGVFSGKTAIVLGSSLAAGDNIATCYKTSDDTIFATTYETSTSTYVNEVFSETYLLIKVKQTPF